MDIAERLARSIGHDGHDGHAEASGERVVVHRMGRQDFDPPVTVDTRGAQRYLEAMGDSPVEVFPEVPAIEGAYRLLLIHLEEELQSLRGRPLGVRFAGDELVVTRADTTDDLSRALAEDGGDPGDHRWRLDRP